METKIASYQESGIRLQLVRTAEDRAQLTTGGGYYQIRKNRKILCTLRWEAPARKKFNNLIQQHLLQTSINYEEEKQ